MWGKKGGWQGHHISVLVHLGSRPILPPSFIRMFCVIQQTALETTSLAEATRMGHYAILLLFNFIYFCPYVLILTCDVPTGWDGGNNRLWMGMLHNTCLKRATGKQIQVIRSPEWPAKWNGCKMKSWLKWPCSTPAWHPLQTPPPHYK